jgi:Spy/CpxP family protein refolding chaperone
MTPLRTPRQIRLLTALLLFGTFLLGAVAGAGLSQWNRMPLPPPPRPAPFLPGPPGALKLTPEQETKAREITERYRPELEAVLRENFPKVKAINEKMEKELREILTPEQRKLLDEMKAHRPPPPPGGMPAGMMPPGGPHPGPLPGELGHPPGGGPPPWPPGFMPPPPPGYPPPGAPQ